MRARLARRTSVLLAAGTVAAGLVAVPAAGAERQDKPRISREVVGTSVLGRPIKLVRRAYDGASRRVLVIGAVHGDEPAGVRVVDRLLKRDWQPRDLDLYLVGTVNPDGSAADRRTNANGVDLNRNFPYRWAPSSPGSTWSGNAPMTEPEAVALQKLVRRLDPELVVVFHQPLFGVGVHEKDMRTVRALAEGMKLPVRDFNCTGVCHGTFTGWVNNRTESLAVTVEFGRTVPGWRIGAAAATVAKVGAGRF